jgi:iron complex outermembrane receptor protein
MLAWELGYRWQVTPRLSLDMATFLNRYRGLASLELGEPYTADGRTVYPVRNQNLTEGRALGGEALVGYSPTASWRLTASYSYVDLNIDTHGQDANRGQYADGSTPRHQFGLRSAVDLGPVQLDAFLRHLTRIRREPQIVDGTGLAGYTELELRAAWFWKRFEFSLTGQNLLHKSHVEFGAPDQRGGIQRSVLARITWRQGAR